MPCADVTSSWMRFLPPLFIVQYGFVGPNPILWTGDNDRKGVRSTEVKRYCFLGPLQNFAFVGFDERFGGMKGKKKWWIKSETFGRVRGRERGKTSKKNWSERALIVLDAVSKWAQQKAKFYSSWFITTVLAFIEIYAEILLSKKARLV